MKRSKINAVIKDMEQLIDKLNFKLPAFAAWTPEDWNLAGSEFNELRDNRLGWDITDFGLNQFDSVGFSLPCVTMMKTTIVFMNQLADSPQ